MPSPFPGMNPFLEQDDAWHDFHKSFIPCAAEVLGWQVRPRYIVKIEKRETGLPSPLLEEDDDNESRLTIRDRLTREAVTRIELLSPTNKRPGPNRDRYLAKRGELLATPTHLVEIDLLRCADRMPMATVPRCDYCVLVSRAEDRPSAGLWNLTLRDRLPAIPIPLLRPDADARLDLQEVLNRVYDVAGYETYIYTAQPDPPLSPEDAAWAQQFLPAPPT